MPEHIICRAAGGFREYVCIGMQCVYSLVNHLGKKAGPGRPLKNPVTEGTY